MTNVKEINTVELLNSLKELTYIREGVNLSEESYSEIKGKVASALGHDVETLEKRLAGLEKEDEFALLCLLLGNVEQITSLDQYQEINKETYIIPDFLMSVLVPIDIVKDSIPKAQRFFVEVKKLPENQKKFMITINDYTNRRNYADLYSLPLYFAIKVSLKNLKFSQWFLISGKTIETLSEKKMVKMHRSEEEETFVVNFDTLLKTDCSNLWLNNFFIVLPKGSKIQKTYIKEKTNILEEGLGYIDKIKISNQTNSKEVIIKGKGLDVEDMVFNTVLKKMAQGKESIVEEKDIKIRTFETDENYFIPMYHLTLESYLHLRGKFETVITGRDGGSIEYYLKNFNVLDQNLSILIRNLLFELHDMKIVYAVGFIPEGLI